MLKEDAAAFLSLRKPCWMASLLQAFANPLSHVRLPCCSPAAHRLPNALPGAVGRQLVACSWDRVQQSHWHFAQPSHTVDIIALLCSCAASSPSVRQLVCCLSSCPTVPLRWRTDGTGGPPIAACWSLSLMRGWCTCHTGCAPQHSWLWLVSDGGCRCVGPARHSSSSALRAVAAPRLPFL